MSAIDVNWTTFLHAHPDGVTFSKLVPDWPKKWMNCCAKLSCAFNATSDPIANYEYVDKISPTGKARAKLIAGRSYLLAVHDVRSYLSKKYSEPERYESKQDLEGATGSIRYGIIAFGLMHVDVWVDSNIHYPSNYNLGYLWNRGHWEGEKLMFWEVVQQSSQGCALPGC
jgi:hypothetical protein